MKTRFAIWTATLFGIGRAKPGPGTWGSVVAAVLAYPILVFTGPWGLFCATIVVTALGIWAAGRYEKDSGRHDPKEVVIDEVAGQWLTYLPLSFLVEAPLDALDLCVGFVAFRLFDITKPWPIRHLDQKVDGGFGTMIDDLAAAIPAALVLYLFSSGLFLG